MPLEPYIGRSTSIYATREALVFGLVDSSDSRPVVPFIGLVEHCLKTLNASLTVENCLEGLGDLEGLALENAIDFIAEKLDRVLLRSDFLPQSAGWPPEIFAKIVRRAHQLRTGPLKPPTEE